MAIWPNTTRTAAPWTWRAGGTANAFLNLPRAGSRLSVFTALSQKTSFPVGAAPRGALIWPIKAGDMSARSFPSMTGAAYLRNGGFMDAAGAMAFSAASAGLSLVITMSAAWTSELTSSNADLKLTLGMSAPASMSLVGVASLAMIVPFGTANATMSLSGSANLKGRCAMSASWGGAEPLSPTGLANAVWAALAAEHDEPGTMGEKLNAAGSAGDPWTGVIEGSLSAKDVLRILLAVQAGKSNIVDLGGGAATVTFRDVADTKDRVTATMAGSERAAVTLDPT